MHLLFVDESGDPGYRNSPTRQYVLAGLLIPAADWWGLRQRLSSHRERMKTAFGTDVNGELHASEFLGAAKTHRGMASWQRIRAIQWMLRDLGRQPGALILLVSVDKTFTQDPLADSWKLLFERALSLVEEQLLVITDVTDAKKVMMVTDGLREERRRRIVEHPFPQDSRTSVILQAVDTIAYLHRQQLSPNSLFEGRSTRRLMNEFEHLLSRKLGVGPCDPTPA